MSKIVAIVGSRDLNSFELKQVEKLVKELMDAGFYILSDGSKTVGLTVMKTAYAIDPSRIYVYLHCQIERNPSVTHQILNQIDENQILTIPGPYNNRNIFYRNKLMVEKSDLVIAFWKNQSAGTKHVIDCCNKNKPPIPVIINEL